MHSLKNSLIVLLVLFMSTLRSEESRPNFLIDERAILDEFRGQLRSKLEELSQNYIAYRSSDSIVWSSTEQVNCAGFTRQAREPLSAVVLNRGDKILVAEWRGCSGKTILRETFIANQEIKLSLKDYLLGQIPSGELKRYQLQDGQGQNVFDWRGVEGVATFTFVTAKFLEIYKEEHRWQYRAQGYSVDYRNGDNSFSTGINFPPTHYTVEWESGDVRILNSSYRRVSVNSFLTAYTHMVQNLTLNMVSGIVKTILTGLPITEFVASGGQNSRLLDEMRLTYTRLLNNLELNLVRQYIQDLIKAIESGLLKITDNRPEN